ncbi:RE1, partial [Symbiodinium sp. CCMP2456]
MTSGEGSKAHEGPPSWDGDASSFQEYEESSLLWEQSVAYEKRYLCGPKLAAALKGAAKRLVAGRAPSWLSHNQGVTTLMQHLRAALGKPQVSDLTEHLSKYFKGSRRRNNEDINSYIARKSEIYLRACQALQRVSPLQASSGTRNRTTPLTAWNPTWNSSRRSSFDYQHDEDQEETEDNGTTATTTATGSSNHAWSDYEWGYGWNGWRTGSPRVLPDYVQGWYLLHDSGLTAQEKNVVQTALQGDFSYTKVVEELRNQCAVLDGQRRDYGAKNTGYLGERHYDEDEDDEALFEENDTIMEAEHHEEWEEAEQEAQAALAAMHQARRTLKDARQKQNSVRLARQYFRTNAGSTPREGGKGRDEKMVCLRCGRTGHRVANCPDPPTAAAKSAEPISATSSFACFSDGPQAMSAGTLVEPSADPMQAMAMGISTADAVQQGKAVIDGGATKTLASISAMERTMQLNNMKKGDSGLISVDLSERPVFGFGNGSEDRCSSTVQLRINADKKPGEVKVHCLDRGGGPMLLSIDTLRKLKAIIDFESDLVCFRALDDGKLVQVERSQTGHQLIPMTEDWLAKGVMLMEFMVVMLVNLYLIRTVAAPTKASSVLIMPKPTKADLQAELALLGETAPAGWTKLELEQRLRELREMGVTDHEDVKANTSMEKMMKDLRRASRLKSTLTKYCTETLQLELTGNEVMAKLIDKATKEIHRVCPAEGHDLVSFGKHADERYITLATEYPEYATWVKTTYKENGEEHVEPRLARLAKWLLDQDQKPLPKSKAMLRKEQGYMKMRGPMTSTTQGGRASGSRASTDMRMMGEIAEALESVRQELAEVKGQRPRKTAGKSDEGHLTDGSFSSHQEHETMSASQRLSAQLKSQSTRALPFNRARALERQAWSVEAATRCALYNGCDLSCDAGVRLIMARTCASCLMGRQDLGDFGRAVESHQLGQSYPSYNKQLPSGEYKSGSGMLYKHGKAVFQRPAKKGTQLEEEIKRKLNVDPLVLKLAEEFLCHERNEIYLDIIPGEAHWQIGTAENAIQGLKTVMTKLSIEDPSLTAEQAMSLAVSTFNHREMIRGFSPAQHVLGCAPDETGRHVFGNQQIHDDVILNQPLQDFRKETELRATAEKALVEWQAQQRLTRAANSRARPSHRYHPGDLVYFWRTQESGKGRRCPGTAQGRFLGPARILAMETRQSEEGEARPSHAIWVVRGRHLMKCSPEQLRPASQREELVESLATEDQTPWTYTRLAEEIGGTQYEDISEEVPTPSEWQRAQDQVEEVLPRRSRIRGKQPAPERGEDLDLEDSDNNEPGQPSVVRRRDQLPGPHQHEGANATWRDEVPEQAWAAEETCYWADETAAVAIELEMPNSNKGWDRFFNNPQAYFVGALKRRAVEVSEKRLSPEDRERFREAKNKEVRNFIGAKAFEALPEHLKPSKEQAIGMRWLLTWKAQEDGSVRPEGDITGAFLQGREYPSELFCIPCDEILESMNLPAGSIVRLKRACYGLVDAPLEWYRTVAEFLESIGLTRLWSDACAWVWRPQGVLRGMITGHVDDFLFGGSDEDTGWQEIIRLIKERFKWGDWDQDKFVQCGVQIETTSEGFTLSQPHYLSNLEEIHVNAQRRKDKKADTTDWEKTQLRALLGGLSWYAQQTGPHIAAEVSLMLSEVSKSRVETIDQANMLLQHARARKDHQLCIFRHDDDDMQFYAWVDAVNKNRTGDGSTQGVFIGASSKQLMQGSVCAISPMSWHSTKIDRSCRSPGSAETQAAVNGEDSLFYMRYQWSEMLYGNVDLRSPSSVVKKVDGCLITDSRNVYDKLVTEVLTVQGAEKKSTLELLSVKESQMATNLKVRWVHSEAQLANALTKRGGKELELYYKMRFMWRIVEDPTM